MEQLVGQQSKMEPRGRLRPEVTQLWCWGPDGATTTEERLTIDDAAAVRDALRKEAGGDRAPYPAWVSTAWHVLRWDEPSARVSWELVSLALHQSASVDAPLPCAALAAFVGTRRALAASRAPAVVEDEARIQTRAAAEDEAPHAKRERRAAAAVRAAAPVAGAVTETLFEDVSEDDVVISKRSGVVVVDDVQCSILVERCRDCRVYVPGHVRCVRVVACVDCLVYVGAARVASLTHCARCVLAAAAHRVVVDASAESSLRLFTPTAPLCVGGAPAALEPLAAAYDGLARDAAAAGLLPPRAEPLGRAARPRPGGAAAPALAAPAPGAMPRKHAAALLRPPGRGAAEPPPLPCPRTTSPPWTRGTRGPTGARGARRGHAPRPDRAAAVGR